MKLNNKGVINFLFLIILINLIIIDLIDAYLVVINNRNKNINSRNNNSRRRKNSKVKQDDEIDLMYANTTRYWDCCKPECGWYGKSSFVDNKPVMSCGKDGITMSDYSNQGICYNNGTAFHCTSQQPWVDPDIDQFSYAFTATGLANQEETDWCCACYELTILEGPAQYKRMVVQTVDTDWDNFQTGSNGFSILIPGGGVGYNTIGCQTMFGAPNTGWGDRYSGVSQKSDCQQLPEVLRDGCKWRFDWLMNDIDPKVSFRRVKCPACLTDRTNCIRTDDNDYPDVLIKAN